MGLGIGSIANKLIDKVLPDAVGDAVGIALDVATGNIPGAIRNGVDLLEDCAEWAGAEDLSNALEIGLAIYDTATGGNTASMNLLSAMGEGEGGLEEGLLSEGFGVIMPDLDPAVRDMAASALSQSIRA